MTTPNRKKANGSKAICRVSNVLRSPSPDPKRPRSMHRSSAQITQILSDLSAGRLECGEARTWIESSPDFQFPKSEIVLSFLDHYLDDEDIRKRDPSYRVMQNNELDKLVSRLQ